MGRENLKIGCGGGLHVAVIMDGNGRWATARGLDRAEGHKAGATAVRRTVEAALSRDIDWLTLFAFSSDNWLRPHREVAALLGVFGDFLEAETASCREHGIRLSLIGRRDRLGPRLERLVETAESSTRSGEALRLRLAIDYSGRDAIVRAACRLRSPADLTRQAFAKLMAEAELGPGPGGPASLELSSGSQEADAHDDEMLPGSGAIVPDVDLLIRTGGEKRLSDFLLWESAYAELVFLDRMWPDFGASDLDAALEEFQGRDRRYGRIEETSHR